MCAQPKVVVKLESEEDMLVLQVSIYTNLSIFSVSATLWLMYKSLWVLTGKG